MAGENGHLERPASPQEIEEALDRLYKGTTNVAIQAADLGISLERLKQLFGEYVAARPIDVNDEDVWLGDVELSWPWV
jgi:hypothetical protein|tara:strand:+ start:88 stop:321 length:234 start_codon:yes stop_codon:yes gene_type:complete